MVEASNKVLIQKIGLKPVYFSNTEILFVGSFASNSSRKNNRHYSDSTNVFWENIKDIFGNEDLSEVEYCKKYRIGLVDVVEECWMPEKSNLDNDIHDPKYTDINKILKYFSNLKLIVVQGDFAWGVFTERIAKKIKRNILILRMDSTSGTNLQKERITESFNIIKKIKGANL